MEGARVLTRDGVPSVVSHSLRLKSLNYVHNQNHYHEHFSNTNQAGYKQGNHPLSRRLNAFLKPLPSLQPCSDYIINVNKGEPTRAYRSLVVGN